MFVNAELAARLEAVQAWRARHYAQAHAELTGGTARTILVGGAPVVYGGPGIPVNRAIGLGIDGPVGAFDLDAVEEFYAVVGEPCAVDLCPLADPTLVQLTAARGYRLTGFMSMLFLPLTAEFAPPETPDIVVTRATADQRDLWLDISCRGFAGDAPPDPGLRRVLAPNFAAANAHVYFAWSEGVPVATGGMYLHAGVAELGGASTLSGYRRRGAQTALIRQRLADARALGCDLAAVLTGPGSDSQRNLQARGFQLAYTRSLLRKG